MEQEFESILDAYPVRLQNFEGPLDLLLHLIKKSEVSIYDIPITLITQQYIDYIDVMQELNLDVASEFLVMAATLIHIKSKMLLPVDPELHVLGTGCRCIVTTDGERYLLSDGAAHPAADPAGAAAHVAGTTVCAQAAGHEPDASGRVMGAGERALRQLIEDGII